MPIQYLTKSAGHRWSPGIVTRQDEHEGVLHLLVRDPSSEKDMHRQLDRELLSRLRPMKLEESLKVEDFTGKPLTRTMMNTKTRRAGSSSSGYGTGQAAVAPTKTERGWRRRC